jgi:hypothetical protein
MCRPVEVAMFLTAMDSTPATRSPPARSDGTLDRRAHRRQLRRDHSACRCLLGG